MLGDRRGLREVFVGDAEREVIDNPVRQRQMPVIVRIRLLRPEADAHAPVARLHRHAQQRPIPARADALPQLGRLGERQPLRRQVADEQFRRHRPAVGIERDAAEVVAGGGLELDVQVLVLRGHRERVVRKHALGDLRHTREDAADVEHVGDRMQQFLRSLEVGVQRSGVTRERFCGGEHGVSSLVCVFWGARRQSPTSVERRVDLGRTHPAPASVAVGHTNRAGPTPRSGNLPPRSRRGPGRTA